MLQHIEAAISQLHLPTQPAGLYEPIAYSLAGAGKRLRPMLLLQSYALYRQDWQQAIPAAVGIETYHNHTLLHDDLMDAAMLRRGKLTVHQKWDANTAILSGDTMLLIAFQLIQQSGENRLSEVLALFTKSAIEICEGQQFDMNFEKRQDVSEEEYLEMIRLKTAVLIGCACKMGAILSDAPVADCEALYAFGENLGMAFQLQDDLLDCFGDAAVFGKRIGGDIVSGKKTFLVHAALARMKTNEQQKFLALLDDSTMDEQRKISEVLTIYRQLDVSTACQNRIAAYFDKAHTQLQKLSVGAEELWRYAEQLMERNK